MNTAQAIKDALELMPLLKIVNENHRLGIEVRIDRDKVNCDIDEQDSSWVYARKNKLPSFFTLIFSHVSKAGEVVIDNYCNTDEDGSGVGDRGECTMIFDGNTLTELHDLN